MSTWWANGGAASYTALIGDVAALNQAGDTGDSPGAQQVCGSMQSHVEAFQNYAPSPDPEYEMLLAAALAQFARGATDCVAGLATNNDALSTSASEELHTGASELAVSNAILKKIISGN